jgi:hypothetical protein
MQLLTHADGLEEENCRHLDHFGGNELGSAGVKNLSPLREIDGKEPCFQTGRLLAIL